MHNSRAPVFLSAIVLSTAIVSSACAGASDLQEFTRIERGGYLAAASDCVSCHTVPGGKPFAGGRAIETPFGNIIASNITPDLETGIGAWSDDAFDAAVRRGVRRDGVLLYPAMPYTAFAKLSRDDVLAIRAFLSSIEPVRNDVPATSLSFPFNIRFGLRVWNALYFNQAEFQRDHSKSAEWNRGAYLVDGPVHCGACHTPKTFLGGDKSDQYLQGSYLQGWYAPDITNDRRVGLGNWTVEDIATYLKTGHNRITAATGPMGEAVSLSTSHLTDEDTRAISTYLKSLPGKAESEKPLPVSSAAMAAGGAIYRDQCSACHGLEGKGIPNLFPALADGGVRANDPTTAIRVVLRGARSVATAREPTSPGMPSYNWQLNDNQVADVLNYIRNSWGGAASPIEAKDVSRVRTDTAARGD
ncbi:MAG: alcohol dehydrogenase [Bradyrhizobium sp.]|nr:alcohol dehydrogenase [Bradyrhizobium sp.]